MNGISGRSRVLAPATLACVSLLQGCITPLVRDQAQVDPVVANYAGASGWNQPVPYIPDCTVQQWIDRATGAAAQSTESRECKGGPLPTSAGLARQTTTLSPINASGTTLRTQAQAELITYADLVCDQHLAAIYGTNSALNFTGGLATTLLSGAAAVASGRSATNLAAGSALFSGTRSLMNSEIYYGYIGPAVITELRALRADLRGQIAAKRACPLDEYPPQEAINDALIYHDACSFATGLASLLAKAGVTRVSEDKLRVAQLAASNQQLVEKRKHQAELEAQLAAAADKAKPAIQQKLDRVTSEIAEIEAVQRYAGVVDPDSGAAAAASRQTTAEKLAAAYNRVKAANPKDPRLDQMKTDASEATANEAFADALMARLDAMGMSRDLNAIELGTMATNDPRRGPLATVVASQDQIITGLRMDLATTGVVPARLRSSIEFGIQDCKKPVAQPGTGR